MVDAEDLFFMSEAGQFGVQLVRRGKIVAERLFLHHPLIGFGSDFFAQKARLMQMLHHLAKLAGRSRQIKQQIAAQLVIAEGRETVGQLFVG